METTRTSTLRHLRLLGPVLLALAILGCGSGTPDPTNCLTANEAEDLATSLGYTVCGELCSPREGPNDVSISEVTCVFFTPGGKCGAEDTRGCNTQGQVVGSGKQYTCYTPNGQPGSTFVCVDPDDFRYTNLHIACEKTPTGDPVPCTAEPGNTD